MLLDSMLMQPGITELQHCTHLLVVRHAPHPQSLHGVVVLLVTANQVYLAEGAVPDHPSR